MGVTVCSTPAALRAARSAHYRRIATRLESFLQRGNRFVVEVGGGRGQLTIPLVQCAPGIQVVVLDSYDGPYRKHKAALLEAAKALELADRISVVRADAHGWLRKQPAGAIEAVVSSEFLPEMTSSEMSAFFVQCHRCLRAGAVTAHSFLSPVPRNEAQRRLIEADSDPRWTKRPPTEWFSPPPALVLDALGAAGLKAATLGRLSGNLVARGDAAREVLRDFGVKPAFWKSYQKSLITEGLEFPDSLIISARKPG